MFKSTSIPLFFLIFLTNQVSTQKTNVLINLNKTTSWGDKDLYTGFVNVTANSTAQVDLLNVYPNVSFIIFQVHSHSYNVTLYNNTYVKGSYVTGTNVGMYSSVKPKIDTFFIINPNTIDIKVLVSIHGYTTADPIPGDCNMEFSLPISPFLLSSYNNDTIMVDAAAAKDPMDINCNSIDKSFVNFYKMYLPERDFDADTYYMGIINMLTFDKIQDNGEYIPYTGLRMRRMLSAYPGTGAIYVAVAFSSKNTSAYSVYVPTYSYACDPFIEGGCEIMDDFFSQMLCASLTFVGLFVCFFGHRFFKTEMFLVGFVTGVVITYILISLMADLNRAALLGASVLSGVCFGSIWLLFWWFYGIPIFAVFLSTLNVGFLFAAIIYHGLPGGLTELELDLNFWTLFIFIMLLTALLLLSMTFLSNILCCAILGAYATVFPMDYYIGSNLRFIIINTVRRAIVPHFNMAVLSPPFQWKDAVIAALWIGLALSGFLVQHYHNRARPPFPPPPRSVRPVYEPRRRYGQISAPMMPVFAAPSERTPLLA
ncbi:transmembrane 7 superfamily member 3-like [Danaus plexippus]|uniref:transmembrane 7 superfamily member 3-like n=1 Tax=Danaus plexippus TaxID=13037 RepID=UPI002AB27F92|nr:transmembrane 7 superfamily member 3-like [Danaus plexippus]